jgi:hypothetical protein
MKAQATVRPINAVRIPSNITIEITFDGNGQPKAPPPATVYHQDTVTWTTAALPKDGMVTLSFDPFGTAFATSGANKGDELRFPAYTVEANPGSRREYRYNVHFKATNGAEYSVDPVIIVDPTGGDDQQPG